MKWNQKLSKTQIQIFTIWSILGVILNVLSGANLLEAIAIVCFANTVAMGIVYIIENL